MLRSYHLSRNVWMSDFADICVFLDLDRNRYVLLTERQTVWLKQLGPNLSDGDLSPIVRKFADTLIRGGFLTREASEGKPIQRMYYTFPEQSMCHSTGAQIGITIRDILRFCRAISEIGILQIFFRRNFAGLVRSAADWKRNCLPADQVSGEELSIVSQKFDRLASIFVTTTNACFFRSLLLKRFLSLYAIPSDWIFAVRTAPFAAHCWVEAKETLLNETCDRAREFRSIMRA